MNTRLKPFDDVRVRKAVNFAVDRAEIVKLFGGLAVPTQNVLPPVYPSYSKLSLYRYDLDEARRLVSQAGAVGTSVTLYGVNRPTAIKILEYLEDQLKAIGLKASYEVLNFQDYWTRMARPGTRAQIGLADRYQAYPSPLEWFQSLFSGDQPQWRPRANYSFANVPQLNALIGRLARETGSQEEQAEAWAEADRIVMQQALIAPLVNRQYVHLFSAEVDLGCYVNHVLYELDFGRLCRPE
jgi:peptide/nickel transport system substrate-binding protein